MTCKCCVDCVLPSDISKPLPGRMVTLASGPARAAFEIAKLWPNQTALKVRFLNGTITQQNMVKRFAPKWMEYANLTLTFGNVFTSQIRISFNSNDGAWSYLGTDATKAPVSQPTMNLGWQDESVILHEFGHMLGMVHEHQSPADNPIQWNRDAVIKDLSGPPNNWTIEQIESNVFNRYSTSQINGSVFDPKSIMLYSFPADWTTNGFHTEPNKDLSDLDKEFAQRVYPGKGTTEPTSPTVIPVSETNVVQAEIGKPGEEDVFIFTAASQGTYTISTDGSTDLVMALYNSDGVRLGQDDDSGAGKNPMLSKELIPGTYKVQIRHYNAARGTGSYGIKVVKG